jgi:hypothetical protein
MQALDLGDFTNKNLLWHGHMFVETFMGILD